MFQIFLCGILFTIFTNSNAVYRAAIVEHNSLNENSPKLTIEKNVIDYVNSIEIAKQNQAQLIIFPEYGLTDLVQDPEEYAIIIPPLYTTDFSNSADALLRLSNAAKEHSIYLVVNLLELVYNAANKTIYYNTNIVIANNGTLIAKYRKINLYQEPKLTPGKEVVTFDTDFGRFGLMIGVDILYYKPSHSFGFKSGITDVILSTAWYSSLPFYMSLEVQVGYALANKVNLLAASLNEPTKGVGGSGIYLQDGTVLEQFITDKPASSRIITTVQPVNSDFIFSGFDIIPCNTAEKLSKFKTSKDFDYKAYSFKSLDLSGETIEDSICHKTFCCNFNIVALKNETNSSEVYKIMAYSGKTTFDSKSVRIQLCNLVACVTQDASTCADRPSTSYTTKFRQISIKSNFTLSDPDAFYRPVTVTGGLQSVNNVTFTDSGNGNNHNIALYSTRTSENVILFGIYGKGKAEILSISTILIIALTSIQALF